MAACAELAAAAPLPDSHSEITNKSRKHDRRLRDSGRDKRYCTGVDVEKKIKGYMVTTLKNKPCNWLRKLTSINDVS